MAAAKGNQYAAKERVWAQAINNALDKRGKALGRIKAGDVVAHVAAGIGGKGGGRPDMAQGGGTDSPAVASVLSSLPQWIGKTLA